MNTLHTFGCSLTASTDWPDNLANNTGYQIHNHALPAGDNMTQVRRFKDCVLQDRIKKNDFVVWEITYLNRLGFRLSPDHHFFTRNRDNKDVNINFHKSSKNIVDGEMHIDYVAFNEDWYDVNWHVQNVNEMLTDLLFCFNIANEITHGGCLIWFADNNILEDNKTKENFMTFLRTKKINMVDYDLGLMNWTRENNYNLSPDGMHPAPEIYNLYADTVIKPRILQK